jgi:hypothetical protein
MVYYKSRKYQKGLIPLVSKAVSVNTNEDILTVSHEGQSMIAFVGKDEVEIAVASSTVKIPRALWNTFAGKSLQLAKGQ